MKLMKVTAWNNGARRPTGAGYGLKIQVEDRDQYFQESWSSVFVSLPGIAQEIEINIGKSSFWSDTCHELISQKIGLWLLNNGYAPWPSGKPPKFTLTPRHSNHFELQEA